MSNIPYDLYESSQEIVVVIPFWGVDKSTVDIRIQHEVITITWQRIRPTLRKDFQPLQQHCFRGEVKLSIDLPPHANYKHMTSTLSKENILTLIIPKNLIPDSIPVAIE